MIADFRVSAGQPVWIDLHGAETPGVREFYAGLLGWTFESAPDGSTLACCDGVPVAGLRSADGAAGWVPSLATPNAVETAAGVRRLGGAVPEGPVAAGPSGRRLLVQDPTGATIGILEPEESWQSRLYEPGALWWAELATPDPAAADAFYTGLFGYQHKSFGDGGYLVLMLDGTPYLGRLPVTAATAATAGRAERARWSVYLVVPAGSTVESCAERARRLGGTVRAEPFDHSHGRATVLADPAGSEFTVLEVRKPGGADAQR